MSNVITLLLVIFKKSIDIFDKYVYSFCRSLETFCFVEYFSLPLNPMIRVMRNTTYNLSIGF